MVVGNLSEINYYYYLCARKQRKIIKKMNSLKIKLRHQPLKQCVSLHSWWDVGGKMKCGFFSTKILYLRANNTASYAGKQCVSEDGVKEEFGGSDDIRFDTTHSLGEWFISNKTVPMVSFT